MLLRTPKTIKRLIFFGFFTLKTKQSYSTYLVFSPLRTTKHKVYCIKQLGMVKSLT